MAEKKKCDTCGFQSSDPDAIKGHERHAPSRGWLGMNETHRMLDPNEVKKDVRARAQEHGETGKRVVHSTRDKDTAELRAREPRPERPSSSLSEEMELGEESEARARGWQPHKGTSEAKHRLFMRIGMGRSRHVNPDRWGPDLGPAGKISRLPWSKN